MWLFNIGPFDLLKEKIPKNDNGLNKNGIGRKFMGISHPGIYTSFQMTESIFSAIAFFKIWGHKGLSLNVNFFFETLFMMTNPHTNLISVNPIFWSWKLVSCFHRTREIIPHFCLSKPSCRYFQYFTKSVRNTWGLFAKRLRTAVLQLYQQNKKLRIVLMDMSLSDAYNFLR